MENLKDKAADDSDIPIDNNANLEKKASISSSHLSARSNLRIQQADHIVPTKFRIGQSEIHIGRIQYNYPKSSSNPIAPKLSRYNSKESINSSISLGKNNSENPPEFYLGENNESDVEIPEDIPEEESEYLTIKASLKNTKIDVNQIFQRNTPESTNKED